MAPCCQGGGPGSFVGRRGVASMTPGRHQGRCPHRDQRASCAHRTAHPLGRTEEATKETDDGEEAGRAARPAERRRRGPRLHARSDHGATDVARPVGRGWSEHRVSEPARRKPARTSSTRTDLRRPHRGDKGPSRTARSFCFSPARGASLARARAGQAPSGCLRLPRPMARPPRQQRRCSARRPSSSARRRSVAISCPRAATTAPNSAVPRRPSGRTVRPSRQPRPPARQPWRPLRG